MDFPLLWLVLVLFGKLSVATSHTCRASVVEREIFGKGFHKEIQTKIYFVATEQPLCSISLIEHFIPDLYIDKYQLNALRDKNSLFFTNVECTNYDYKLEPQIIDVESPSFATDLAIDTPNAFTLKQSISFGNCISEHKNLTFIIKHPIHIRYHEPQHQKSYSAITMQSAISLIADDCNNSTLCMKETDDETFAVPVGRLEHKAAISVATLTFTCLAAVYIILLVKTS